MIGVIKGIKDRVQGKAPRGSKRSREWPEVRNKFLESNPNCVICGGNKKIEVHHITPFHMAPELELNPENLITLCEAKRFGANCHLLFGHLGNYRSFNPDVITDSGIWSKKIESRTEKIGLIKRFLEGFKK